MDTERAINNLEVITVQQAIEAVRNELSRQQNDPDCNYQGEAVHALNAVRELERLGISLTEEQGLQFICQWDEHAVGYHYTGSRQQQIGGDGPVIGSTLSTAHDDPRQPGYISLCSGPIY